TKSDPEEAPSEVEELQSVGSRVPLTDTDSEGDELREEDTEEDVSLNPDNERESQGLDNEGHGLGDKDHGLGNRSQRLKDKGLGLEEEEVIPEGEQQAVLVVKTAMSESLGLSYGALRRHDFAVEEDRVPNTFEVGQSFRVYTDVLAYAPPAAPVQTLSFPEWSLGSLLVSPSSSVVPSHIASLVATLTATISIDEDQIIEVEAHLELYGSILYDHTHRLDALPPTLVTDIDRDVRELYTRSGVIRDEIFLEMYRFRNLEREQERTVVTFKAL
nr:hypothetical protein [Tanacetum cinerariifolium]